MTCTNNPQSAQKVRSIEHEEIPPGIIDRSPESWNHHRHLHDNRDKDQQVRRCGNSVTVCIVALANGRRCIISACDGKGSFPSRSADEMYLKNYRMHKDWYVLAAGNLNELNIEFPRVAFDTTNFAVPVSVERIRERLNDAVFSHQPEMNRAFWPVCSDSAGVRNIVIGCRFQSNVEC